jgi:hypothetical protein
MAQIAVDFALTCTQTIDGVGIDRASVASAALRSAENDRVRFSAMEDEISASGSGA